MIKFLLQRNGDVKLAEGYVQHLINMGWSVLMEFEVDESYTKMFQNNFGMSLVVEKIESISSVRTEDDLYIISGYSESGGFDFYTIKNYSEKERAILQFLSM